MLRSGLMWNVWDEALDSKKAKTNFKLALKRFALGVETICSKVNDIASWAI